MSYTTRAILKSQETPWLLTDAERKFCSPILNDGPDERDYHVDIATEALTLIAAGAADAHQIARDCLAAMAPPK